MSGNAQDSKAADSGLKAKLEQESLFNWHSYLAYLESLSEAAAEEFKKSLHYRNAAAWADALIARVYLGCNLATLIFAILAFASPPLTWLAVAAFAMGIAWNYIDAVGGLVIALYQHKIEDKAAASINVFSSLQLTAATTAFFIGFFGLASGSLLVILSAASGFGFAACIGVSCYLEYRAMRKGEERIKKAEDLGKGLPEPEETLRSQLSAYLEKDRKIVQEHRQSAKIWLGCFIAMIAIAIVGILPMTPFIQGLLLIAVAVVCCASAIYRIPRQAQVPPSIPEDHHPKPSIDLNETSHLAPKEDQYSKKESKQPSEIDKDHPKLDA